MSDDNVESTFEDIGCLEAIRHLHEYLDGELDEEAGVKVKEHMDHCRSCFSRAEFEVALSKKIHDSGKRKAPEQLKGRIRKLIDTF